MTEQVWERRSVLQAFRFGGVADAAGLAEHIADAILSVDTGTGEVVRADDDGFELVWSNQWDPSWTYVVEGVVGDWIVKGPDRAIVSGSYDRPYVLTDEQYRARYEPAT